MKKDSDKKHQDRILKLQTKFNLLCDEYIKEFVKKHDIEFDGWVGNHIGGVASFIDQYFFNYDDIVYDINTNQPKDLILQWQDESIENPDKNINYYSYSKGLRHTDL